MLRRNNYETSAELISTDMKGIYFVRSDAMGATATAPFKFVPLGSGTQPTIASTRHSYRPPGECTPTGAGTIGEEPH